MTVIRRIAIALAAAVLSMSVYASCHVRVLRALEQVTAEHVSGSSREHFTDGHRAFAPLAQSIWSAAPATPPEDLRLRAQQAADGLLIPSGGPLGLPRPNPANVAMLALALAVQTILLTVLLGRLTPHRDASAQRRAPLMARFVRPAILSIGVLLGSAGGSAAVYIVGFAPAWAVVSAPEAVVPSLGESLLIVAMASLVAWASLLPWKLASTCRRLLNPRSSLTCIRCDAARDPETSAPACPECGFLAQRPGPVRLIRLCTWRAGRSALLRAIPAPAAVVIVVAALSLWRWHDDLPRSLEAASRAAPRLLSAAMMLQPRGHHYGARLRPLPVVIEWKQPAGYTLLVTTEIASLNSAAPRRYAVVTASTGDPKPSDDPTRWAIDARSITISTDPREFFARVDCGSGREICLYGPVFPDLNHVGLIGPVAGLFYPGDGPPDPRLDRLVEVVQSRIRDLASDAAGPSENSAVASDATRRLFP